MSSAIYKDHETLQDLSNRTGVSYATLHWRIRKGWPMAEAVVPPVGRPQKILCKDGRCQSIYAWAKLLGVNPTVIRNRLRRGWPVDRALTPVEGRK